MTLQEDLTKFTDPIGGHVARARNNVVVANQAFDLANKRLETTRSELFEEVRDRAGKLSELRQNTTDQRLAIELEEATVFRREKIRKQAPWTWLLTNKALSRGNCRPHPSEK